MDDLDGLLAKQQILETIHDYARSMDRLDADLGKACFHPDATVDYGETMFRGSGYDFIDFAIDMHARALLSHSHQMSSTRIRLDGNRAVSETYGDITLRRQLAEGGLEDSRILARYLDRWERRGDGRWRIAQRTFVVDFDHSAPAEALYAQRGTRDTNDPSYALFE